MWLKKNPFSISYKDYLNNPESYWITWDDWKKKNEYEDSDRCDQCGAWKGPLAFICPECKL
jgi:uncharacterized OB-fold protein